jgi:tetratricopeptide (TPR) repeat protein
LLRALLSISILLLVAQAARSQDAELLRAEAPSATAEYNMGNFKDPLAHFQALYKSTGKNALLFNVAQCQRQLGNLKDAAFSYGRFIQLEAENPNVPVARDRAPSGLIVLGPSRAHDWAAGSACLTS